MEIVALRSNTLCANRCHQIRQNWYNLSLLVWFWNVADFIHRGMRRMIGVSLLLRQPDQKGIFPPHALGLKTSRLKSMIPAGASVKKSPTPSGRVVLCELAVCLAPANP